MAYRQQHDGYSQSRQQQYYEQQQQQQPRSRQQQPNYHSQHEQQYYDYGYAQDTHEQWDSSHYDYDQHGYYDRQGYRDANEHARQDYYASEQAYHEQYQQPPIQQRPDPRSRPAGRGNAQQGRGGQGRGGLRPPGLDRSLFNQAPQKSLPLDNPFPVFPNQKAKQSAPDDTVNESMSQMTINDQESQGRSTGPSGRGQPMPSQNRGPQRPRPESDTRQDSGHFEDNGQSQRGPPRPRPSGQRPPMNVGVSQGLPRQRGSDPKSPSQGSFGPTSQRSMTMPQNFGGAVQGGYDRQHRWDEHGSIPERNEPAPSTNMPPRPSTAGGTRQNAPRGQQPPMPPMPTQQQQYHAQVQPQQAHDDEPSATETIYDDYYGESGPDRRSIASEMDMPNFDAIPETSTRHRRGDSIDNHLGATAGLSHDVAQAYHPDDPAIAHDAHFEQHDPRSHSQASYHEEYHGSADYEMTRGVGPGMTRANTDFVGSHGPPGGPRGRGPPQRGTTTDGVPRGQYNQDYPPNYDPRFARQPPPVQRGYSGDSTYSEPPNPVRNFSSPVGPGNPIRRPGTAGPALGRQPYDPLGRRPGTTQPQSNVEGLPAHPTPVRAGLMQHQQAPSPQNARPPPVRQYDNDSSQANFERQNPKTKRPDSIPHPVTHDEINRLRNTWKANPTDNITGLQLAKKLVEASTVLADEGGTADSRTRNKNRDKFLSEALKIVKKLVSASYPDAMFYLADSYGQGLMGLQPDTKEAFSLYQSAAKAGHAASAYRTAVCCELGYEEGGGTKRDPLKAVQWYRRAAALGDTPALYKMGMVLLKGLLGQQRNLGEALNMLKRAASQADKDNPHALHELALIYESQTGNERIIRDEAYALQLLHQAADLGYKFSQFRLGQAYEYGLLGCPIDPRTSIAWYTKAAAQEEHQSELALSGWYLTGIQGVLEQSDTEAYLWARKAACAEPPLPKAMFAMGYFTEIGIGCPRSLDEAKRWYGRAAAYKFPKAQERLEELKRGGAKAQLKRERISRSDQKHHEENCTVM